MATVANLVVEIAANTKNLDKQLNSAKRSIDSFADNAVKSFKSIGIGLATAFSVGSLISSFNEAINQIDKMSAAAVKLGISAQSFQQLSFLAQQSDTELGSLETSMVRLSKSIGEVSLKGGENARVLSTLGLSIGQLISLSPDQQFLKVAQALGKVEDHTQKVYLGTQLFGRGFAEILPLINEDINKLSQEFSSLGVGLTQGQLDAVDALDKTEKALGTLAKGFVQQTSANIAPALDVWLTGLKNIIIESNGVAESSVSVASIVVKAMSLMTDAVNEVSKAWKNFKGSDFAAPARAIGVAAAAISAQGQNLFAGLTGKELPFPGNTSSTNRNNASDTIFNTQGQFNPQFNQGLQKAADQLKTMADSLTKGTINTQQTSNSMSNLAKTIGATTDGLIKFNQSLLESALDKSGVKLNKEEQDFINKLNGFSGPAKPISDNMLQSNIISKLSTANTIDSNQAIIEIFRAIGNKNNALRQTQASAGFGFIQDATGRQAQIGTPPSQKVDVAATVKVEVNQNLLNVVDQRIETKMNDAARGAVK